jgi:hypothetical protein
LRGGLTWPKTSGNPLGRGVDARVA